jgi:hypothetical protein
MGNVQYDGCPGLSAVAECSGPVLMWFESWKVVIYQRWDRPGHMASLTAHVSSSPFTSHWYYTPFRKIDPLATSIWICYRSQYGL